MKNIIAEAQRIATLAHAGQKRKYEESDRDYIVHPIRVADRAKTAGMSNTAIAAAFLHDVFEDCAAEWRDSVADNCGASVFAMVCELTNPSKGLKSLRALRKEIDRAHLKNVSLDAVCLKFIDRTDNLLHMFAAPEDFKRLYIAESAALLETLKTNVHYYDAEYSMGFFAKEYEAAMKKLQETLK